MNEKLARNAAPSGKWKAIDFFIPEWLRRIDHRDRLFKARAVVVVHLITILTLLRLFRELLPYRSELGSLQLLLPVIIINSVVVLCSLATFRKSGSFKLAANRYGIVSTITIVTTIMVSGGFYLSPGMTWWPILIMYVFIMSGWTTALVWAFVGLVIFLLGMQFEPNWVVNVFSPDARREAYISSVILCGFHLMAALWFLEFCNRQLLHRAQVERDRALFSAAHDPLTGLANRKAFQVRVGQAAEHQKLAGGIEAVLMIDLDGFKLINDNLGHKAGDQVLATIARRLKKQVRRSDFAARLGGDEFAILLCDLAEEKNVRDVARKLHAAITAPIDLDNGEQVTVGASIGIALDPSDGDNMETLLHNADLAMYEAKAGGHPCLLFSETGAAISQRRRD